MPFELSNNHASGHGSVLQFIDSNNRAAVHVRDDFLASRAVGASIVALQ